MNLARLCMLVLCLLCSSEVAAAGSTPVDAVIQAAGASEKNREFADAALQYRNAISTLAAQHGEYSPKLFEPLLGLGRSLIGLKRYRAATDALRRAQSIIHRNEGVDSIEQLGIIDLLTDIHLARHKPWDADRDQQFSLFVSEHNFGHQSPSLLPALYKLSQWYVDTGQFIDARNTLMRAAGIVTNNFGETDPQLISILTQQARIARLRRVCCSYKYLEKAQDIARKNPNMSSDERASIYLQLGDAYLMAYKSDAANKAYARAWKLMGSAGTNQELAKPKLISATRELHKMQHFNRTIETPAAPSPFLAESHALDWSMDTPGFQKLSDQDALLPPQQVFIPPSETVTNYHLEHRIARSGDPIATARRVIGSPIQFLYDQLLKVLPIKLQQDPALEKLAIHLDFTVSEDGAVSDVVILQPALPYRVTSLMRDVLHEARFRPRMVDGRPVVTKHVKLIETFDPR
ncbi:MAG TPA: hypothetical protein VJ998_10355 [Pseudomonadales bacterium]|nr:hypothetical protein [Pseudomonadales bacterium]